MMSGFIKSKNPDATIYTWNSIGYYDYYFDQFDIEQYTKNVRLLETQLSKKKQRSFIVWLVNLHDFDKENTNTTIKAHGLSLVDKFEGHITQTLLLALPEKFQLTERYFFIGGHCCPVKQNLTPNLPGIGVS